MTDNGVDRVPVTRGPVNIKFAILFFSGVLALIIIYGLMSGWSISASTIISIMGQTHPELLTSPGIIKFLAATFAIYYIPWLRRHQILILLGASLVFFLRVAPHQVYLLVISAFFTTVSSYQAMHGRGASRKFWVTGGVVANLFMLAFFKYKGLLCFDCAGGATDSPVLDVLISLPLPIGISFYTFHGISLMVDVYRRPRFGESQGNPGVLHHFLRTYLYLMFFPQIIAGPIVKAHDFFPQMVAGKRLRDIDWYGAGKAIILGYFLKRVVADNLASYTAFLIYPQFLTYSSGNILAMVYGYSIQIFADFCGYSLIAIGFAKLFGYELPINFLYPYASQTFSDFWRRWHISLSSWLREYLYYPIGGSHRGKVRTYFNLLVVMGLGGLWHGAGWNYAAWGLWHGLALVIERLFKDARFLRSQVFPLQTLRILIVFNVVTVGWVFFKLPNFHDVCSLFFAVFSGADVPFNARLAFTIFVYSLPVIAYHGRSLLIATASPDVRRMLHALDIPLLGGALALALLLSGEANGFVYFQF